MEEKIAEILRERRYLPYLEALQARIPATSGFPALVPGGDDPLATLLSTNTEEHAFAITKPQLEPLRDRISSLGAYLDTFEAAITAKRDYLPKMVTFLASLNDRIVIHTRVSDLILIDPKYHDQFTRVAAPSIEDAQALRNCEREFLTKSLDLTCASLAYGVEMQVHTAEYAETVLQHINPTRIQEIAGLHQDFWNKEFERIYDSN